MYMYTDSHAYVVAIASTSVTDPPNVMNCMCEARRKASSG